MKKNGNAKELPNIFHVIILFCDIFLLMMLNFKPVSAELNVNYSLSLMTNTSSDTFDRYLMTEVSAKGKHILIPLWTVFFTLSIKKYHLG